ncbi:MAG: type II toxin-antitoxin system PemK/MazF family toxin [Polaromonas sp.]|nr:type II toxin-antitoxin system PemK/MazF family toxin [Gemmatimonadaceae bacterium]
MDPAVGSEQGGERRPVLVVSNDGFNANFPLLTVLSCTKAEGKKRKVYSFEVVLPKGMVTAKYELILMPQQIRTIAKTRLVSRIGAITDLAIRAEIENRILEHLDIAFEAESPE